MRSIVPSGVFQGVHYCLGRPDLQHHRYSGLYYAIMLFSVKVHDVPQDSGGVEPSPAKKQRTGVGRVVPGVPSTLLEPVCPTSLVAESNRHLQDVERSSHLKVSRQVSVKRL